MANVLDAPFSFEWIKNLKTHNFLDHTQIHITHDKYKYYTLKDPFYKIYYKGNKITKVNTFLSCIKCTKCNTQYIYKLSKIQTFSNKLYTCNVCINKQNNIKILFDNVLSELIFKYSVIIDNLYRKYYFRNNLTLRDFSNIKSNISYINNNIIKFDEDSFIYTPYYKESTANKILFKPKLYNKNTYEYYDVNNMIFKCDQCKHDFLVNDPHKLKNKHKVLCENCSYICKEHTINKIFNINDEIVYYNTKLELYVLRFLINEDILFENYTNSKIVNNRMFILSDLHILLSVYHANIYDTHYTFIQIQREHMKKIKDFIVKRKMSNIDVF